jgi:hypothetical protein
MNDFMVVWWQRNNAIEDLLPAMSGVFLQSFTPTRRSRNQWPCRNTRSILHFPNTETQRAEEDTEEISSILLCALCLPSVPLWLKIVANLFNFDE